MNGCEKLSFVLLVDKIEALSLVVPLRSVAVVN